jgi:hypothetical protein
VNLDAPGDLACAECGRKPREDEKPGVSVATNGTNGCTITFAGSVFTDNPVLMLTPINGSGGNPTLISEGPSGGNWFASYTFASSPPPLLNFIATQRSS